jgi:uncharacterized protein (DUF4415 family)
MPANARNTPAPLALYRDARALPKHAWPALRRALKAKRAMHLDADSWFIDSATGKPIAPHPELERPLTATELKQGTYRIDGRVVGKAEWQAAAAKQLRGGRPPLPASERRQSITLRLPPKVVEHFRKAGPGWQTRMGEVLERASKRK